MEKKDFEGKIGTEFSVQAGAKEPLKLKLVEVSALKKVEGVPKIEGHPAPREEPFSLVFIGPEDYPLADHCYNFSAEGCKDQTIFISAFQHDDQGIHYDAVFN
jgi:hypothetical protein